MNKFYRLGATHQFPLGKLNRDDEGELKFGVRIEAGNVKLDFGTPVAWMAFPPQVAEELARALVEKAKEAREAQS